MLLIALGIDTVQHLALRVVANMTLITLGVQYDWPLGFSALPITLRRVIPQ
ncbi:hypothetical protein D3C85_1626720 [compost metagenome]